MQIYFRFLNHFFTLNAKKKNDVIEWDNKANKKPWKKNLIFAGIFILDFLARSVYYIFYISFDLNNKEISHKFAHDIAIFIDILFRLIFYFCIIKGNVYYHKIVSIVSIIIPFLFLIISDIYKFSFNWKI